MPKRSQTTLTDKGIRALKPTTRDYEISDARLPGFGVRVSRHGTKTFFYRYQLDGRRRRCLLDPYTGSGDLADARQKAERYRGFVLQGLDPQETPVASADEPAESAAESGTSFESVARRWLEEYAKSNKEERSWREDLRILEKDVFPRWKGRSVEAIRARDVRELLRRVQKRGGVMANRTHAVVRVIFSWALEEELVESNPAAIRRVHKEKPPKQVLSDGDLKLLWEAWKEEQSIAGAAMCLYLLTGLRRGELKDRPWSSLQDGRLEIPEDDTKNGIAHTVFLSRQALGIVEALHNVTGTTPWLFPSPRGGGRKHVNSWNSTVERFRTVSGVQAWSIQTLRRTASTILAREGVEPHIIDIFLNHVQGDVTHRHYVRYRYAEQVAEANQRLGDFVERLVGGIAIRVRPYRQRTS